MTRRLERLLNKIRPFKRIDLDLGRPSADQLCAAWVDVDGWARARDGAPVSITVSVNGHVLRELRPDVPRPDVANAFGDPRHTRLGFSTRLFRAELPRSPRFRLDVTVRAQTSMGRLRNRPRRLRLPIRLAEAGAPPLMRGHFGGVWNATADTQESAQIAVCATADPEEFRRSGEATAENVALLAGVTARDTVLEIGCGVARVGLFLAPRCGQWIGADVSTKMIEHAKASTAHLTNVRYELLNGYDLAGVSSDSIDVVYCTGVFMHLDEWDRFRYIAEAWRVLRPGGRVYFNNVDVLTDEGWQMFLELAQLDPASRPANISKTSTPQELENYAVRAGFADVRVQRGALLVTVDARKPSAG